MSPQNYSSCRESFYSDVIEKTLAAEWSKKKIDGIDSLYDDYDQTPRDLFAALLSDWVKKNIGKNEYSLEYLEYAQTKLSTDTREGIYEEVRIILLEEISDKIDSGDTTVHLFPQK